MNNIESSRSKFFPKSKIGNTHHNKVKNLKSNMLKGNDLKRKDEIEKMTAKDAKVSIPSAVKDFAKIRQAVDQAEPIDNSAKIADLKQRIQAGTYSIDYDALADKMLSSEY